MGMPMINTQRFRIHKFIPNDIDTEKWDKRSSEDNSNFLKDISKYVGVDGRGIKLGDLFDLSIDQKNIEITFRNVYITNKEKSIKDIIHGLCPQLESFITLINWIGPSDNKNETRFNYHNEIKELKDFYEDKIVKIIGNYRLKKENYSTILVGWSNLSINDKEKYFYDWENVPFIKRSGETFTVYSSPVFMSSLKSEEKNVCEDKLNYFTAIFSINKISEKEININIYNCASCDALELDLMFNSELFSKLNKESFFLGLFCEKIYRVNKSFNREFLLVNLKEIEGVDIAQHFILERLYYNYLINRDLLVCTKNELIERCKIVFNQIYRDYKKQINIDVDMFIRLYIKIYFEEVDNNIYYNPLIIQNGINIPLLNKYVLKNREKELNPKEKLDFLGSVKEVYLYEIFRKKLEFLNKYNYYSKRTIIDLINKNLNIEGECKWKL
jgi:hypothetical protein